MGKTSISWTARTHQTVYGCALESPGCASCYAMAQAGSRLRSVPAYQGLTKPAGGGAVWNGKTRASPMPKLADPLRWQQPSAIFLNSMSDLWMDGMEDAWINRTFAMIAMADWHTFQILTKRPERQLRHLTAPHVQDHIMAAADDLVREDPKLAKFRDRMRADWPLSHVILGVSVEDRARTKRIDVLRQTPADRRFLSIEPLLEDLGTLDLRGIHQVIVGGESHTSLRVPRNMTPAAVRSIRDQCAAANVAFHFKQIGSNHHGWPAGIRGKGDNPEEWPADLRIQQPLPDRSDHEGISQTKSGQQSLTLQG